jgi:hypothetical protein
MALGDHRADATVLQVRLPGTAGVTPVPATLQYDGSRQLVKIVRQDGVQINYEYLPNGLCFYRKVSGDPDRCVPSERLFIWDGSRLLEEYDINSTNRTLRARYYYTSGDVPVAADMAVSGTTRGAFITC